MQTHQEVEQLVSKIHAHYIIQPTVHKEDVTLMVKLAQILQLVHPKLELTVLYLIVILMELLVNKQYVQITQLQVKQHVD